MPALTDDEVEALPPAERAWHYLLDYREPGADVLPSEQLRIAELLRAGLSPAAAAEITQAESDYV